MKILVFCLNVLVLALASNTGEIAFFAGECPYHWSEYKPLEGKYVKGADDTHPPVVIYATQQGSDYNFTSY